MSAETVSVSEESDNEPIEQPELEIQEEQAVDEAPEPKEQHVPLSALQKERRKRQEIEQELRQMREEQQAKPREPDDAQYEAATKADLKAVRQETLRDFAEDQWIREYPERKQEVDEKLTEFLKRRPNLAEAIKGATNRYAEAWELMDKLTPKQKTSLKSPLPAKKDAPGSPGSVPKATALNAVVDYEAMTDAEFNAYRKSVRKVR